jgi:nucleoside-diphosphate-sugar epimerase
MTDAIPKTVKVSLTRKRVMVLGATGTIGQATVRALVQRGHDVVCFVRTREGAKSVPTRERSSKPLACTSHGRDDAGVV